MDPLSRSVDRALDALAVDRAAPVLVACSGGPDSAALAHIAMALARAGRLGPVTLCHVDHQLRPGSAREAELVARLAAAGGADMIAETVAVDLRAGSLEAAARKARYAALERAAAGAGAAAILTGHTRSDQAETVLMRLVTGTGLTGLAGVRRRRGRIARPLLHASRADTAAYCARHHIEVASDPMNDDPRFLRVQARTTWLPALARGNPRVEEALASIAEIAAAIEPAIDYAAAALARAARREDGAWDAAALRAAPGPVRAAALSRAAIEAGGAALGRRHQRALAALVAGPPAGSRRLDLPGLVAWREYDHLRLEPAAGAAPPPPPLRVSGPDAPYEVRPWRPGDRMRPVRLRGRSRKLSDLFTDARVPRRLRAGARVVVRARDGQIEWAEHIGPAFGSAAVVTLTPEEPVATNKNR